MKMNDCLIDNMAIHSSHEIFAHGYGRFPHDLLQAIFISDLNFTQAKSLLGIHRFTVGCGEMQDKVSIKEVAEFIGCSPHNVSREITYLKKHKFILVESGGFMSVNFDYSQWPHKKDRITKPQKPKESVSSKMETTDKPEQKPMAATTNQSLVNTNQSLAVAKPKNKPKAERKVTPKWFKELFAIYPSRLRGNNHAAGWKKWQSMNLTEEDCMKANEWLVAASADDPDWGLDSKGGYILGWIRFIGDTRWRATLPTKQKSGHQTIDFSKVDYAKATEEFNNQYNEADFQPLKCRHNVERKDDCAACTTERKTQMALADAQAVASGIPF